MCVYMCMESKRYIKTCSNNVAGIKIVCKIHDEYLLVLACATRYIKKWSMRECVCVCVCCQ